MTSKQIINPGGAFVAGGTWWPTAFDNDVTSEHSVLINNTSLVLYTGDIVCLDATGTQAILASGAADPTVIGTVGSAKEMSSLSSGSVPPVSDSLTGFTTLDGTFSPFVNVPWQTLTLGFTNGSANITSASAATTNPLTVGLVVLTPYNSTTNTAPQIFQVMSNGGTAGAWTAVGAVISGAGTTFTGTTGSFICQVGNSAQAIGPGFLPASINAWSSTSLYPPNTLVPIIIRGYGRVNINGVGGTVRNGLINVAGASVIGAQTLAATPPTVGQIGTFIAIALEAYAARDQSLTNAGISGHDSVRALIGKF